MTSPRPTQMLLMTAVRKSGRDQDEHILRTHADFLERGWAESAEQHSTVAAAIRRFLANEYPVRDGRPRTTVRNAAIAELHAIMRHVEGDRLAANRTAAFCRKHGISIKAQRVARVVREPEARQRAAERLARIDADRAMYPDADVVAAHLRDLERTIRHAAATERKRRKRT